MPLAAALIGGGASLIGSGIQAYTNYKAQQEELEQRSEALRSCSSGIPTASGNWPPNLLMVSTSS